MENLKSQENIRQEFEKLFQKHSDVVYRLCLYKTSNKDVAHDLTQETFTKLWKSMSSENDIQKPKQYIYQISRNLIVDYYKSKKALSLDALQEDGFEPSSTYSAPDIISEVNLLKDVIESLEEQFREVIYLRFIEGMRVKDIADILNVSENLVSIRISRGKQKLYEKFQ